MGFFNDNKVNKTLILSARLFVRVYFSRSSCIRYMVIFLPEECYNVYSEKILGCLYVNGVCIWLCLHVCGGLGLTSGVRWGDD